MVLEVVTSRNLLGFFAKVDRHNLNPILENHGARFKVLDCSSDGGNSSFKRHFLSLDTGRKYCIASNLSVRTLR